MIAAGTHRLTLGHVKLHLPDETADREAWRRRVVEALGCVDVHPRLPPQAILVVRRMPDPQPGLLLEGNGWRGSQQWSGHTQTWLDACWRRAVRPAYEAVAASTDAVWFADLAEWLACLSWDVHSGLTAARWWWETWLPQLGYGSVGDMLFKLWQDEARWLPQALSLVQAQHDQDVYTLLQHLGPEQAHHIRQLVLANHELPVAIDERHVQSTLLPLLPRSAQRVVRELPAAKRGAWPRFVWALSTRRLPHADSFMRRTTHHCRARTQGWSRPAPRMTCLSTPHPIGK